MSHPLYSDAYEGLPSTAPIGCPHLIRLDAHLENESSTKDLRMADGIATLLYHYNPDVLTKFLDKNIVEFKFVRIDSVNGNLTIIRDGDDIVCGQYLWNDATKFWKEELAFSVEDISGIWAPFYVNGACVNFTAVFGEMSTGPCEYFGAKLTKAIILGENWKSGLNLEFEISMKAA